MKKYKRMILFTLFALALAGSLVLLIVKNHRPKTVYSTEKVMLRDIKETIIASGAIVPMKEIEVKSPLSGVVDDIFAIEGMQMEKGQPLLSIKVIPNSLDLNSTEAALEKAELRLSNTRDEMERRKKRFESGSIAEMEYEDSVNNYRMAMVEYREIRNRMQLIREGVSPDSTDISNVVTAPISGLVLEIPVKEGTAIQENSGMSAGTTVVILADMSRLIFEGEIDETAVSRLSREMPVNITVAALEDTCIPGELTSISPRGRKRDGSVMFPIEVSFIPSADIDMRAGYSASAEIIVNSIIQVPSIHERDIIYENGLMYAEKEIQPQKFEKTEISTGVSDGIYTEITGGLNENDHIRTLIENRE